MKIEDLREAIKDLPDEKEVIISLSGVELVMEDDTWEVGVELSGDIRVINYSNEVNVEFNMNSRFGNEMFLCDLESTGFGSKERIEELERELEEVEEAFEDMTEKLEDELRESDQRIDSLLEDIENLEDKINSGEEND